MNVLQRIRDRIRRAKKAGEELPVLRYIVKHESARPKQKRTESKHIGGKIRPRGWHQAKRRRRKAYKLARRAHRYG